MYRLRYDSVIDRQGWDLPVYENMESDAYDNPATRYFVWCDEDEEVRGCTRLYPTDRPYMLQQAFPFLATYETLPSNNNRIMEGSRICIDKTLPAELRRRINAELSVAYLEFGLANGIERIIGVMQPLFWRTVYISLGWETFWYGDTTLLESGEKVRAGGLILSPKVLDKVRNTTGIHETILDYGQKIEASLEQNRKVAI